MFWIYWDFSHTVISRVYRVWSKKKERETENIQWAAVLWAKMPCWCKRSGLRQRPKVTQLTAGYSWGLQKTITERATRPVSKRIGCSSRRPQGEPLLSAENRKLRLQFTQALQNWTIEHCKTSPGLMSHDFSCDVQMVGSEFGCKHHGSLDPSCLVSAVHALLVVV